MIHAAQSHVLGAVIAFGLLSVAACDSGTPTDASTPFAPSAAILGSDATPQVQNFKVCKVGTDADFSFSVNGGPPTDFSLADGACVSIHQYAGWPPDQISVTEKGSPDVTLDHIGLTRILGGGPLTITSTTLTNTYTASGQIEFEEGYVATFYNRPVETGFEGCTPGFWKTHPESWPVSHYLDFDQTFGVNLFSPNITLWNAINLGGGGVRRLARHGTAAYLNTLAGVDYPYTTAQVIAYVQAGNADVLAAANELGCPF